MNTPDYLRDHADLWAQSPREANLAWWRQARFGLFIHYGLYSQLKEGEWGAAAQDYPGGRVRPSAGNF